MRGSLAQAPPAFSIPNSDREIHSTSHADCDQRVWTDTQLAQMPSQLIGATIQLQRQALVLTDDSDCIAHMPNLLLKELVCALIRQVGVGPPLTNRF